MNTFDDKSRDQGGNPQNKGIRSHDIPTPEALQQFMMTGWSASPQQDFQPHEVATFAKSRRDRLSSIFAGVRIVLPAGSLKVRSNDTDYRFRAHSAFSYYSGIGASDAVPDSALVLEPTSSGHDAFLFVHPRSPRDNDEFFRNARYGEFWIGRRMTLEETERRYGIKVQLVETLEQFVYQKSAVVIRGQDPFIDGLIEVHGRDEELANATSVMRMVKDSYEINEMQKAIDATVRGFADMVRVFPAATQRPRGERVIESVFFGRARIEGYDLGYDSIVAAGSHACILHWIKNDGDVIPGDLVLIDAGVEVDSYYTADITRTLPVNGKFSEAQRKIYNLVYEAQKAGLAAVKPGNKFSDINAACMEVIAKGAHELGVLPIPPEESLKPENGLHRRWMFHGSGHHLGLDVHDCAKARKEQYSDAILEPGMILTVEPGFYIQADDELFPPEYRGIGVRIEDDVLVTESGCKVLSSSLPSHPDEVEVWMAQLLKN